MSEKIYHLTLDDEWKGAQDRGFYAPNTLTTEGFIHCSTKNQLLRVANIYFKNQVSIKLIVINMDKLESKIKWEPGTDKPDELFPHVFGIINLDAIEEVFTMKKNNNGLFSLPDAIND